jgi:hypothetical protein
MILRERTMNMTGLNLDLAKRGWIINETGYNSNLLEHAGTVLPTQEPTMQQREKRALLDQPLKVGIKSLRVTLPDEIFYWRFCFLNRVFR